MPILYHSPQSRSETVAALARMLSDQIEIREVTVSRQDGTGAPDPANPHPEKKVPFLTDGAESVRERGAIITYLTDLYPEADLAPLPGEAGRGAYLSWLTYYHAVMEPIIIFDWAELSHPILHATFRDRQTMIDRLCEGLEPGPWLLGERFSAADMLCASPFHWFPEATPDVPAIRDWVARTTERMG
ncbi:glutathione S-transferase family protein [Palleronia abyssalis]|uniref:Glutathione S-transferase GST-6.0 n=1 Tax=Palleronia abyssalis TaxID=1501240 RepID=A0A2R8BV70_9RHOB|nr:glutathione S-transferase family protein [Palleronia abyssalis]SPJ24067.1 Glutathione S-transferase GST-6.0 [Palleronia abyssalis]